ncbi:sugar transferase [Bacillus rubiinfantis]|uniref:sugar transferase n=1 Tax=Bacillus rubiinfantis TaxID=1499680 RepID=UPI0005AA52BB|nr:sugar transferase [Bacillus rubiinfantis]
MKRLFDLLGSSLLIVFLFPLMVIIGGLIFVRMGSPILFKQMRPGLNEKPFFIYKFRTMIDERDKEGNMIPEELRITRLGYFLRKYSLDELPQLFNVWTGKLSFVGPRPLLMEYLPLYTKEQARRHEVKPGITGWAQVNGRNLLSWEEKFRLDVWYVDHQSLRLDLKIMFLTIKKVVIKEGISAVDHSSMEDFKGSGDASM